MQKFVFEGKKSGNEPMHRRVNSNTIDMNVKPKSSHRRTLSNSDIKFSPLSINTGGSARSKAQLILPDSLNSSSIQPYLNNEENNFVEILDSSIKHFTNINIVSNPLKQIAELKAQIAYVSKTIESFKENKTKLTNKMITLKAKTQDSDKEIEKLQNYVEQLETHAEKMKGSIKKAENELKGLKKKNQMLESSAVFVRNDGRRNTDFRNEKYGTSSNDEFEVFNAEENTCMPFSDPFQFVNPSPKVQGKNLYGRGLRK